MEITGVILAGGKSSRMGANKGLMDFKGKPMFTYAVELLKPFCDSIVISANSIDYIKYNYPVIEDSAKNIGPIGGIYSVLKSAIAEKYFIVSCDLPYLSEKLITEILKYQNKADIIVPRHSEGKIEPLAGIYSQGILPLIKHQIDIKNYKLMDLLKLCNTHYVDETNEILNESPMLFKNINTLKDAE